MGPQKKNCPAKKKIPPVGKTAPGFSCHYTAKVHVLYTPPQPYETKRTSGRCTAQGTGLQAFHAYNVPVLQKQHITDVLVSFIFVVSKYMDSFNYYSLASAGWRAQRGGHREPGAVSRAQGLIRPTELSTSHFLECWVWTGCLLMSHDGHYTKHCNIRDVTFLPWLSSQPICVFLHVFNLQSFQNLLFWIAEYEFTEQTSNWSHPLPTPPSPTDCCSFYCSIVDCCCFYCFCFYHVKCLKYLYKRYTNKRYYYYQY